MTGLLVTKGGHSVADALRLATFQVVSVITSTGFATADFATWDERSRALLLGLMFVGRLRRARRPAASRSCACC